MTYETLRRLFGAALLSLLLAFASAMPAFARFTPVTCDNNPFSRQQEITEGNKVAAQVYQQMPVLPENDPITRYIQNLGARLVQFAPKTPGLTQQWPFNFHVVASKEINAFALPGGSIFVNLGTIQAADTEAQLAGVMAHETSHVIMRHSTCNMKKQQSRSLLYGLGAIGSAILLGNGAAGQLAQQGIGFGQNLDFLHMSRGDEKQADLLGTEILYDAHYDPRGLPQFFETLQAKYGNGGAQFLSDHPNPGNRTEYVDQEIASLPRLKDPRVTSPEFKTIHALAQKRNALSEQEIKAGGWRRSGQYAAGPGGQGAMVQPLQGGGGAQSSTSQSGQAQPLSRSQLALGGGMTPVSTSQFSVRAPSGWQKSTGQNGSVTLAPPGGAGGYGVSYGVLISLAKGQQPVRSAQELRAATQAIVQQLTQGNTGMSWDGQISALRVGGRDADAVTLRGQSPVAQRGAALSEHDWMVTVSRPDGAVSYLVFVAPEQDFQVMYPTFKNILDGFRPR